MTFSFMIDEVTEVHRDPGGHYHHWTIFSGTLLEGTMKHSDRITIPYNDGTVIVSTILEFIRFGKILGNKISVGQFDAPIGVMTWVLAADKDKVEKGIATYCTLEAYRVRILEILQHHPERIFHNQGKDGPNYNCVDCTKMLRDMPEAKPYLEQLATGSNSYFAERAKSVLKEYEPYVEEPKVARRWWQFWRL